MKKILLLTAQNKHESLAPCLREALAELAPEQAVLETVDLFDSCFGRFGDLAAAPWLRGATLDRPLFALRDLLRHNEPDVVLVTAPVYLPLLEEIFREGREKHFAQIAFVSEAHASSPLWLRGHSEFFLTTSSWAAELLQKSGVPQSSIEVTGYPVPRILTQMPKVVLPDPAQGARPSLLYLLKGARKKAPKLLDLLLKHPEWDVTVSVPGDTDLEEMAREKAALAPHQMRVVATEFLPEQLQHHHLVISRAEDALVAAVTTSGCPLIAFPDKEDFTLLRQANAGVTAEKPRHVVEWLDRAFRDQAKLWSLWKKNLTALARPDASRRIAQILLDSARVTPLAEFKAQATSRLTPKKIHTPKELLLCDLHTHTTWSDGKLTIAEMVDFYGQRGFDCLCITDHLCDPEKLLGKLVNFTGLVIPPKEIDAYFAEIESQKKRAWKKYDLLLMSGIEFNKDGYTPKTSTHLLGVDLQEPIDPSLNIKQLITEIQAQGGLAIASHPHEMKSAWGKNTLYLWENQLEYAPLLDAWEVANRDDIFNPVGLKKLPFIASSDFHKPKHIHSWKTLLYCEKEAEAIKHCIRVNRDVSLTLYRDHRFGYEEKNFRNEADTLENPAILDFEADPLVMAER